VRVRALQSLRQLTLLAHGHLATHAQRAPQLQRLLHGPRVQHSRGHGQQRHFLQVDLGTLRGRIKKANLVQSVAKKLQPQGQRVASGGNVHDVPAHGDLAHRSHHRAARIAPGDRLLQHQLGRHVLALGERQATLLHHLRRGPAGQQVVHCEQDDTRLAAKGQAVQGGPALTPVLGGRLARQVLRQGDERGFKGGRKLVLGVAEQGQKRVEFAELTRAGGDEDNLLALCAEAVGEQGLGARPAFEHTQGAPLTFEEISKTGRKMQWKSSAAHDRIKQPRVLCN